MSASYPGAGGHHQTNDTMEAFHSACHLEIDLEKLARKTGDPDLAEALELARQCIDIIRSKINATN